MIIALLCLGIGLFLAGSVLFAASFLYKERMANAVLIRWIGLGILLIGLISGLLGFR